MMVSIQPQFSLLFLVFSDCLNFAMIKFKIVDIEVEFFADKIMKSEFSVNLIL